MGNRLNFKSDAPTERLSRAPKSVRDPRLPLCLLHGENNLSTNLRMIRLFQRRSPPSHARAHVTDDEVGSSVAGARRTTTTDVFRRIPAIHPPERPCQ